MSRGLLFSGHSVCCVNRLTECLESISNDVVTCVICHVHFGLFGTMYIFIFCLHAKTVVYPKL